MLCNSCTDPYLFYNQREKQKRSGLHLYESGAAPNGLELLAALLLGPVVGQDDGGVAESPGPGLLQRGAGLAQQALQQQQTVHTG